MALSVAAYAKHRGVSRQSVYKAIKSGRIQVSTDGLIDVSSADAAWLANTDPGKGGNTETPLKPSPITNEQANKREAEAEQKPAAKQTRQALEVDREPAADRSHMTAPVRPTASPVSGGGIPFDYQRLRSQKLATDIAKSQLALKEAQGELVKRSEIKSALFARARQDRDMVLNFSSRYGAAIAAELDADPRLVMAALDKHLRSLLKEMSEQSLSLNVAES